MLGLRCAALCLTLGVLAGEASAAEIDPKALVEDAETLLWGRTLDASADMTITTPSWTKTVTLRVWMDRPAKSFVQITAPAKDAGIRSLRVGSEMWNYIPAIERTIKIPPSMMLQPWLGSDFTNDDLVKESSLVVDYDHKLLGTVAIDGEDAYQVEALPKDGAAVVWGRVVYTIGKTSSVPKKLEYFDERGRLLRVLTYTEVRTVGGRAVPTRWEMRPLDKPGKRTVITIRSASYDKPIDGEVFSLRNLR